MARRVGPDVPSSTAVTARNGTQRKASQETEVEPGEGAWQCMGRAQAHASSTSLLAPSLTTRRGAPSGVLAAHRTASHGAGN